jgi:hypothetical protein
LFFACLLTCRRKQHFGRKYKVVFVRAVYGTPLEELDAVAHWNQDVKVQHYAQLPHRDVVAQLLDFKSASNFYIPRGDLDPGAMPEFQSMTNGIMPWLGKKLARAEQVGGGTLLKLTSTTDSSSADMVEVCGIGLTCIQHGAQVYQQ